MANKDAPRSVPPMSEMPPTAARSREIAAEQRAAALPGPEERADRMAAELTDHGMSVEDAQRIISGTAGEVVQGAHQATPESEESGLVGGPASSWPSGLSVGAGVEYVATGRVRGPLTEDSASKLLAPIVMLQVGWLDSAGRIWGPGEITSEMLGGASMSPLLVQVSHD